MTSPWLLRIPRMSGELVLAALPGTGFCEGKGNKLGIMMIYANIIKSVIMGSDKNKVGKKKRAKMLYSRNVKKRYFET